MKYSKLIRQDNERQGNKILFYATQTYHSLLNNDDTPIITLLTDDEYSSRVGSITFDEEHNEFVQGSISYSLEMISKISGDYDMSVSSSKVITLNTNNFIGSIRLKASADNAKTSRVINFRQGEEKEYVILNSFVNPYAVEHDAIGSVLYYTGATLENGEIISTYEGYIPISWGEENDTLETIFRTGTTVSNFHNLPIEWNIAQNPEEVIGYTVLYGKTDGSTRYDGDKLIITLTGATQNTELVNDGWEPIALYAGNLDYDGVSKPVWQSVKKASNGLYSGETLATGTYQTKSSSNSNMGWGYNGASYYTDSGITDGYPINQFYWDDMFADETRKNTLLGLTHLTDNFGKDASLLGGTHSTSNQHYWPTFFATYMLETPDGVKGKFYVPTVKEGLQVTKNITTWSTVMSWIGYSTYYANDTRTCIEYGVNGIYTVSYSTISKNTNKGSGAQTVILYHYDLKGEYQVSNYKSLTITADDVKGMDTTTTIHYTYITDGMYQDGTKVYDQEITGDTISDSFGINPSETESREIPITYSNHGLTASTVITQGRYMTINQEYDLNSQWVDSTKTLVDGYDVFMSNSNKGVNNSYASMKITFKNQPDFKLYINSYAESSYDYTIAWEIDKNAPTALPSDTSSGVQATTKSKQSNPTSISNYTEVSYPNDGDEHFVWITYRKDSSGNQNDDRGYVAIPNE